MSLAVGIVAGVLLGYLIGRWRRPRTHVALHTADPTTVTYAAHYPRQAVSWSGIAAPGATEITFSTVELPEIRGYWLRGDTQPEEGFESIAGFGHAEMSTDDRP